MRVGLIAPIKFLDRYCTTGILYCLPKLLVESKDYKDFYVRKSQEGCTVILDTVKLGWRRSPEDLNIVEEALRILRPTIVILPSVMFDTGETKKAKVAFITRFRDVRNFRASSSSGIPCIEGTDERDALRASSTWTKSNMLALPSHMLSIVNKVRDKPIIYIENKASIEELEGLEGILVTSLPIRLGMLGRFITDTKPIPPTLNFYEEEDTFPMVVAQNIKETLEYYGNN